MTKTTEQARKQGEIYIFLFTAMFIGVLFGMLIAPFLVKDITVDMTVRCFWGESAVADSANREATDEDRGGPVLIDSQVERSVPENRQDASSTAPTESLNGGAFSEGPINEFMTSDPEGEAPVDKGARSPSGN